MADKAFYTFLPWARRGLAAGIKRDASVAGDGLPLPPRRMPLPVTMHVRDTRVTKTVAVDGLRLYGPGDVTNIDTRVITRVSPLPGSSNFKPNDLPLIEFSRPDFPWLFTPSAPDNQDRLLPWLCLVCVEQRAGVALQVRRNGLPVLIINPSENPEGTLKVSGSGGELPNLQETWAWAHVQVAGKVDGNFDEIAEAHPERVIARLLSPRNLKPYTRYTACLVPVFEEGRLAALGESPTTPADTGADEALSFAWNEASEKIRLPVFHHWEFGTSFEGDFESLVRLLEPRPLPDKVGWRSVDIQAPGFRVPRRRIFLDVPNPDFPNPDEPVIIFDPESDDEDEPIIIDSGIIFDPELNDPQIEIPREPTEDDIIPPWAFDPDINRPFNPDILNPNLRRRSRSFASEDDDATLDSLDETQPASGNVSLDQEMLARLIENVSSSSDFAGSETASHANLPWNPDWLTVPVLRTLSIEGALRPAGGRQATQPPKITERLEELLSLTEVRGRPVVAPPIYGRWHAGEETLSATTPAWLRDLNLAIRQRIAAGVGAALVRDQQEQLMASAWDQVGDILRINQLLQQAQLARQVSQVLYKRDLLVPLRLRCEDEIRGVSTTLIENTDTLMRLTVSMHGRLKITKNGQGKTIRAYLIDQNVPPGVLSTGFRRITRPRGSFVRRFTDGVGVPSTTRLTGLYRALANKRIDLKTTSVPRGMNTRMVINENQLDVSNPVALPPLDEGTPVEFEPSFNEIPVKDVLCEGLDPERTVCRRIRNRLPEEVKKLMWSDGSDCSLEPILAAPQFPRPMYIDLKERSQSWLLPGLEDVPPNTLALLETNPPFIEAFMAGLNHAMAAELLWRRYPTDQRGTYFRRFWDTRGALVQADASDTDDIELMHTWRGQLGSHLNLKRGGERGGDSGLLVLLVRGALLQTLPNTVIYAVRGVYDANRKRRPLKQEEDRYESRFPVFRGTLEPDVTFLGFNLTEEEARGNRSDAGWFFMLEGQPTEPRFGLDETVDFSSENIGRSKEALNETLPWSDIAWGDLIAAKESEEANQTALDELTYAPVAMPENENLVGLEMQENGIKIKWGYNSAHMAYITLNLPIRVAVHADEMIKGVSSA